MTFARYLLLLVAALPLVTRAQLLPSISRDGFGNLVVNTTSSTTMLLNGAAVAAGCNCTTMQAQLTALETNNTQLQATVSQLQSTVNQLLASNNSGTLNGVDESMRYAFCNAQNWTYNLQETQIINSTGTISWLFFFTMNSTNYMTITTNAGVNTTLYVFNATTNKFQQSHQLPVTSAVSWTHFNIANTDYLAVSSQVTYATTIYRYNTTTSQFALWQTLVGQGLPEYLTTFWMNGTFYLAVPNFEANTVLNTVIYSFNSVTAKFTLFQNIPVGAAASAVYLFIGGSSYLAVAGEVNGVLVYKYDATQAAFVSYQSLTTSPVSYATTAVVGGNTYILACHMTTNGPIDVYLYNGATSTFSLVQQFSHTGYWAIVRVFPGTQSGVFLAITSDDDNGAYNPVIMRYDAPSQQFVPYVTLPVANGWSWDYFQTGSNHYYLGLANLYVSPAMNRFYQLNPLCFV